MNRHFVAWLLTWAVLLGVTMPTSAQSTTELIQSIQSVGKKGQNSTKAIQAWNKLVKKGPDALVPILTGISDDEPIAANYLRSAFETIAEQSRSPEELTGDLERFVISTKQSGIARRLAYEWLTKLDSSAPERLLPKMLNDPGAELRRDAVAVLLESAKVDLKDEKKDKARATFNKALKYARDRDQVQEIAKSLAKLGKGVNLTDHFGFITDWYVIAPFDSTGGKGFNITYPPEKKVDLSIAYKGKGNNTAKWSRESVKVDAEETKLENLGVVDLNDIIGDLHGVVAYGYTVVESPKSQPVQIRAASNNAVRMYLNGKEIYFREEYHHGTRMDQHIGKGMLKKGRNEILIKVCQNEQEETWAQQWSFSLRVTDDLGAAIPLRVKLPQVDKE